MKAFIWVMVCLMAVDIVGKAAMLHRRLFTREPSHMIFDIVAAVLLIIWAAYLLGSDANGN